MSPPPSTGSEPVCTSTQCMYQGLGNQERKKWSHPRRSSGPRVEIRKGHQQQWDEIRPVSQPHPPKPQPRGTTVLLVLRIHPVIASISTSGSFILSSSLSLSLPPFSSFFQYLSIEHLLYQALFQVLGNKPNKNPYSIELMLLGNPLSKNLFL